MKTITINVTQQDIDAGIAGRCAGCPVALAGSRALGYRIYVGSDTIGNGNGKSSMLPRPAIRFVRAFDTMGREFVRPFSFRIYPPTE